MKISSAVQAQNQQNFIELCALANVQAPAFGQKNMSLMSAGTEVHEHHAVTLWECLFEMTRPFIHPNEWKIVMSTGRLAGHAAPAELDQGPNQWKKIG